MNKKIVVKFALATALLFGVFTTSCNNWDALEMGHEMFGKALDAAEAEISSLCNEGKIKEGDCGEINIRLDNTRTLHEKAGILLRDARNIAEIAGKEPNMDTYMELFNKSIEALDNIYDFSRLCGFNLETKK